MKNYCFSKSGLIMNDYKIAISGHRPKYYDYDMLVERNIREYLYDYVCAQVDKHYKKNLILISGMALGVDTLWAQVARDAELELHAYIPFKGQESKWPEINQERYHDLLKYASKQVVISEKFTSTCMRERNIRMVDDCDEALAIFNSNYKSGTGSFIRYIDKIKKTHTIVGIEQFMRFGEERTW